MAVVDVLHSRLRGLLERRFFKLIIGSLILVNPLALLPQVWAVFTAPSVEGVSLPMWIIFAVIQIAVIFEGIRVKSSPMFWSMLLSVGQSVVIITMVVARG